MNWHNITNIIKRHWLLIFILAISTFTRFYRLPATVTFLEDEGRDVLIEHRILTGNAVALGPQTSTGNMYLGPFYYYFTAPALFIASGDPMGPIVLIALTGVVTTYLFYSFVSGWFSHRVGIISAILYAVLPAAVYMSRNSWNPNLVPLITLLFIKVMEMLVSKKELKYFLLLGLLGGVLVQLHYMVLLLLGISALYLIWFFRKNIIFFAKGAVLTVVGFLLPLTPFILFEFKNDFVNTQALVKFVLAKEEHNIRYSLPLRMYQDKVVEAGGRLLSSLYGAGQVTKIDPLTPYAFWGFISMCILALRKSSSIYKLLFTLTFGSLIMLGIYQENIHLHYLGFLFPLVIILSASIVTDKRLWLRLAASLYLVIFTLYGSYTTYRYIISGPSSQLTRAREVASYIVKSAGDRSYNAVTFRDTSTTSPFAYFLEISGRPPSNKLESTLFLICVDRPCDQSDLDFDWIFRKGPSHPSLGQYLGHPFIDDFSQDLQFSSMEHISHGVWVGETSVKLSL